MRAGVVVGFEAAAGKRDVVDDDGVNALAVQLAAARFQDVLGLCCKFCDQGAGSPLKHELLQISLF